MVSTAAREGSDTRGGVLGKDVQSYGQVTPAQSGAAPAVEVPIAVVQSEVVRISHVPGWPAVVDWTQQATGNWHPAQMLPVPELKPPLSVQAVASVVMRGPLSTVQSASVAQLCAALLLQVPDVMPVAPVHVPVLVTAQHSTRPGLPHVERAEHGAMSAVEQPCLRSWLRRCTTQL